MRTAVWMMLTVASAALLASGCNGASCETLCGELQRSFETLQSGVEHSNRITGAALGNLSSSVNDLNEALDAFQKAQR